MSTPYFNDEDIRNLNRIPIRQVAEKLGIEIDRRKKAKCIIHSPDNDPSMSFDERPGKNMWYCFVCGAGGGVIRLVEIKTGWSFPEVCSWLSIEFNIKTSSRLRNPIRKPLYLPVLSENVTKKPIVDTEVYHWIISSLSLDKEAKNYLTEKRKFPLKYIYDLNVKSLYDPQSFFEKCIKRFGISRLLSSGIAKKNRYDKIVPIWWDEVILFPFYNERLEIIYIQARRLKNDQYPKYVNLNSIPLPLYNMQILTSLEDQADILICEGIPDCIASLVMGKNAVAIIGANGFKDEFVDLFKRFQVTIIPDNDKNMVGEKSALKIKAMLNKSGIPVKIIPLTTHKDIAELYEDYAKQFNQ